MSRTLLPLIAFLPLVASAADAQRISFLEQEVRNLQRQVQALSRISLRDRAVTEVNPSPHCSELRVKTLSLLCGLLLSMALAAAEPPLAFRIDEGQNINSFLRQGPVAAHLLLRSGTEPRILVAFPAGNSGVGLWFKKTATPVTWKLVTSPQPLLLQDAKHRPLYGIEFEVEANVSDLSPNAAVLSSVRVLRDYELQRTAPAEVMVAPRMSDGSLSWTRDRLDGAAGYRLTIKAGAGAQVSAERFGGTNGTPLRLRIQALSGETPLKPLNELLTSRAGDDARSRNALAFLSYQEKFLAGSWRFDTYFGRDTLISALLLAPVLQPQALESAMASVLDRLAPNGEVAHEEDIGEFAVLRNSREGRGKVATPIYDYGMVDDDFLLAPLAWRWLELHGESRARDFLAQKGAGGITHGRALVRNLAWVTERAAAFAQDSRAHNLVGIKSGRMTGNWRDSEQGLGRGRYPYDVNAALVPAALDAAARINSTGILNPYLDERLRNLLFHASVRAEIWSSRAPPLFAVDIPAPRASAEVAAYAKELGVDDESAQRQLGARPVQFHALSLDAAGQPIPILNSDEGFRLLLTQPGVVEIARYLDAILRRFPAGLVTDAGALVANPVFAAPELRKEFSRYAYHGTVVWSWQQALLVAGLDHQLRRDDLPEDLRARLRAAHAQLWNLIDRSAALRTSELWSWSYSNGQYRAEPFGRPGADVDESNAAQLWSTVYLGLTRDTSPGN